MSRAPARGRSRRTVPWVLAVLTGLALALGATAGPAAAAGDHHAAVIVDTGTGAPKLSIVAFSGDSISGLEALQLAGADPAVIGFSGLGGAVCALYGVGHPATSSTCLGEPSDARFWAYWHVPAGQSGFDESTYSRAGAASVRVHDGDVDGWRYGTGEPPRSVPVVLPTPDPPPVTTPAATAPPAATVTTNPSSPTGVSTGGPSGVPAAGATSTTRASGAPPAAGPANAAGGSSTTPTTRDARRTEVAAERASANRDADGGGGSPVLSIAGFVAVLAVLGAGIFFARRARVGRSAGGS